MSKPPQNPRSNSSRTWVYLGLLVLGVVIAVLIAKSGGSQGNTRKEGGGNAPSGKVHQDSGTPEIIDESVESDVGPRKTRSTPRDAEVPENLVPGEFPLVERIISDSSQSDVQAAEELAEIARRTDISLDERFEALAHGLNLDFKSFTDFAAEPNLPLELAQRYMDELLNQNRHPHLQIEGCLALLNHREKDIRGQAADQLAFLVEKEELVESLDELKKAAYEKLESLRNAPPIESPADSTDEVIEIAPK